MPNPRCGTATLYEVAGENWAQRRVRGQDGINRLGPSALTLLAASNLPDMSHAMYKDIHSVCNRNEGN